MNIFFLALLTVHDVHQNTTRLGIVFFGNPTGKALSVILQHREHSATIGTNELFTIGFWNGISLHDVTLKGYGLGIISCALCISCDPLTVALSCVNILLFFLIFVNRFLFYFFRLSEWSILFFLIFVNSEKLFYLVQSNNDI